MAVIKQCLTSVNRWVGTNKPEWIVIHNTANGKSAEGMALNNCNYFKSTYRGASAHYFIDDGDTIWQCVADTDSAWHCGDADTRNGCTNLNSIGIEVCEPAGGEFTAREKDNLNRLVAVLMDRYGIPASRVVRHNDVTGKRCPWFYSDNASSWNALKSNATKTGGGAWVKGTGANSGRWWWRYADGTWPANKWLKIDGAWYWFKADGWAAQDEWVKIRGTWYWFKHGCQAAESEVLEINGKWYAFDSNCHMMTSIQVAAGGALRL